MFDTNSYILTFLFCVSFLRLFGTATCLILFYLYTLVCLRFIFTFVCVCGAMCHFILMLYRSVLSLLLSSQLSIQTFSDPVESGKPSCICTNTQRKPKKTKSLLESLSVSLGMWVFFFFFTYIFSFPYLSITLEFCAWLLSILNFNVMTMAIPQS